MKSHFVLKTLGITLFILTFFAGYLYLLKNPVFPVTMMPLTELDVAVGFKPATIFLYASLWLYVTLPPALQATRRELIYYGLAVGGLCVAGLAFFFFGLQQFLLQTLIGSRITVFPFSKVWMPPAMPARSYNGLFCGVA